MTLVDKINKTLKYCDYVKDLARNNNCTVRYRVEIENTYETETEDQHAVRIYRRRFGYCEDNRKFLHSAVCQAVLAARQHSQTYNCLCSAKVWVMYYNSECELIDEDPIDEYEINFEKGIEVE